MLHPRQIRDRHIVLALLLALILEAGLVALFLRIPDARAYVPLRVATSPEAYHWGPTDAPRWFHTDDPTVTQAAYFREALASEVDDSASIFERELAIMNWVRSQALVVDATQTIPGDPISVHHAMQAGTPAQCGNFATLLAASSASVGLLHLRTWYLLSYDGPGGQGHVANEVWVPELDKWVFLDPMNNAYVLFDGQPASLLEVRQMVLTSQRGRLDPVVGVNAHTPREELLDLYELVMVVPSLDAAHTPLRNYYRQTWLDRLVLRVPEAANLRYLAGRMVALLNGEARQVILIDSLAREYSQPMPIWQAKVVFFAIVGTMLLVEGLVLWLALRGLVRLIAPAGLHLGLRAGTGK